jgi:endonuclease/exonuclease/phosphatase family metal-dependent hydrolase
VTAAPATVRVMTWNIHGAVGRNPRFDVARVVEFIRRIDPDVLALQEVDSRHPEHERDTFEVLQEALHTHGIGAKSIVTEDGAYGQMLISRWPLEGSAVHDLSYPEREPRRAIGAEIETPLGRLRVVATHLGLSMRERHGQAKALLDIAGNGPLTTIVLGDFNDWLWAGSVRKQLSWALPGRTRDRTFPSWLPFLRLDRIYCRPGRALVKSFVDPLGRHISDHLPVIADVQPGGAEWG